LIPYIGDFVINSTLRYYYASNAASGASAARTTAGAYRVYKNISTTERTSTAGITDYSGFDSVTGLNAVTIDLSNNTDAGFYAAGNDYVVVLVGAVVDSQTVNVPLFQFSIENRAATLLMRGSVADSVWDEPYADHTAAQTFGKLMDLLRKANYVTNGLVVSIAGANESYFGTNLTSYLNGTFDHQTILFITGSLAGQSVPILTFVQTGGAITVEEPYTSTPQPSDEFVILPDHVHAIVDIADGILSRKLDSSGDSADVMNERTVRSALRAMRNKVIVNSGTISVYKEDDATAAWEGTLSNTADVTVNPDGGS
jgi:hypothetical protein